MKYNNNNLPEIVNDYLEEIYNNEELRDVFYDCDIEIYEPEWIKDVNEDRSWFYDMFGTGESNYDIKPFARSGTGGLWVVLNNEMIGYMGTEGQCGIVARNINEFMNIVATWKGCYLKGIKDEESFIEDFYRENKQFQSHEVCNKFIEKHGFEKNPKEIYKILKLGITVKPFFVIKATDDEYLDSYSLLGSDDGQESLEYFIDKFI